jgi:chromosome segregation ATPase
LGKILTVLVVLVSIAVAVLVTSEIVLRENWKARYDEEHAQFEEALKQRDEAVQDRNQEYADWAAHRANLEQRINTLTSTLNDKTNTISLLTEENNSQEKRLQDLVTQLTGLKDSLAKQVATIDEYRNARDQAVQAKHELETMYAELDAKYRAAVDDIQNLRENLRQAKEELAAAQSKLSYVSQQPGVEMPREVPAVPQQKIQGLVTSADNEARVAEVNLGTDDGVVKGMTFYVYNEDQSKYLATLRVTRVSNDSAAGELRVIRGDVKVNDHVTNRFE